MTLLAKIKRLLVNAVSPLLAVLIISNVNAAEHQHQGKKTVANNCQGASIACAKTVTSAFSPNGDLWRVWVNEQRMFFQISKDDGQTFAKPELVAIPAEKISARNENRPKIGFDNSGGVYLSWAMPRERKYTADVRFSYSKNYGKTFSKPITVNSDNLLAGHSFNEMLVTANGEVSIVWLDGRLSHQLRKQGKKTNGSALFLAKANPSKGQSIFTNQQLANNTCVCCRISMDFNQQNELAILWRHIYGDNIREFALLTLTEEKASSQPIQVSYDHWKINGCPHQGGGISVDDNNRYHLVWFNQGSKGKGIFYANSDNQGVNLTNPVSVGELSAQAAHPHVMENSGVVDIVWTQFNGIEHQLWHQQSKDSGKTFSVAKQLAIAKNGADRPFIIKKQDKSYISWQRPKQGHWFKAL